MKVPSFPTEPWIIAEIGTSHNGSLDKAYQLIEAAAASGADCIKFQLVYADEIIHPASGEVPLPGGMIPLYQRFKELEQPSDFFFKLKEFTESLNLDFLCSPFGIKSARILKDMEVRWMKIASPELNHLPLLKEVAQYEIPVLLSTGVSRLTDIEKALEIIGKNGILLHCITAYPAPEEEFNLKLIPSLHGIFGVPTGISDHSLDPILVPLLSTILGAKVIEKHFTLDKKDSGLDDPTALNPAEFEHMVSAVKKAKSNEPALTISYLKEQYGSERIDLILGDGVKRLANSEKQNYLRTNRSLHALTKINAGEKLTETNCALLRTEKTLRVGLAPEFLALVLGKTVKKTIPDGEGIRWEDLL
ncbi:MAG: N-acetylneuraminate synthase family protein [Spirochaetes bacterium]|nr:N-acetylneuraminate synthase family protein [Spirochaetota bacterium]